MRHNCSDLLAGLRHRLWGAAAGLGRPIPSAVADHEYASGAWDHFDSEQELPRYQALATVIGRLPPQAAVLDIGCGTGRLEALLQARGHWRWMGIDHAPEAIRRAQARQLPDCAFALADFEQWRPATVFDAIVFNEVLGYARDPGKLVADLLPALAPGGFLLVSQYRAGHWAALWRRIEHRCEPGESTTVSNDRGHCWDLKVLRPRPNL